MEILDTMTPEIFARWYDQQGYDIIQTESAYWYNVAFRVYQAIPFHLEIVPSHAELEVIFKKHRALAVRYSAPKITESGVPSYHVIYEGSDFLLEKIPKKPRKDIMRGADYAQFHPISLELLAEEGWINRKDTLSRQNRMSGESKGWWQKLCTAAIGLPGFNAWGVIRNNSLIASALTFRCDDCVSILYQQSMTEHLAHGINNFIAYEITSKSLKDASVKRLFYGMQSLDAPETVDAFKFRMGFSRFEIQQVVTFSNSISPFVNHQSHRLLKIIRKQFPGNSQLSKLEGMISIYLQKVQK